MRIGLFGGSFNPPHIGHGLVCYYLLETTELETIWLVPTFKHAFSKSLAPYEARLEMCRLLAEPFDGKVLVSDIERTRGRTSYTIDTVRELIARHPQHTFEWIIGADILEETTRWKDFDVLEKLVCFRVLGRQGYAGSNNINVPIEMPAVSSTEIRALLARAESVDHLVPRSIALYLRRNTLYTPTIDRQT